MTSISVTEDTQKTRLFKDRGRDMSYAAIVKKLEEARKESPLKSRGMNSGVQGHW